MNLRIVFLSVVTVFAAEAAKADPWDRYGEMNFEGRYIIAASDADMVASAYVDGDLGPREGSDRLSVIELGGDPRDWRAASIEVSNSVAGPPAVIDVTADGRYAVVIETWTPRPEGDGPHRFSDLGQGSKISVVDLTEPSAPAVTQTVETPERPDAVRISPSGDLVAVTFHPRGGGAETPLAIYRFEGGQLGEVVTPPIPEWNAADDRLIDIDWHPTEPVLAMINETGANLRFARVSDDLSVEVLGNIVDVERAPFRVEFTPDGRHVVVNGLYWGPDIAGRWIEAPRGSVLTVRMNAHADGDKVRHALVSRVATGVSPEGLAVSPNGRWVATMNLERSYLPYDDDRITWFSSITLAALDQETGSLRHVGDFNYDGILPEAAVFDNSGSYLAVVNFDHFNDRRAGGSVDFWRIDSDPLAPDNVQLVRTEHSVPVARGAHSVVIAR